MPAGVSCGCKRPTLHKFIGRVLTRRWTKKNEEDHKKGMTLGSTSAVRRVSLKTLSIKGYFKGPACNI